MTRNCLRPLFIVLLSYATTLAYGQEPVVKQLKVSTPTAHELAPVVKDSILYFISNRKTNLLATYVDQDDELLYSLFSVPLKGGQPQGTARHFSFSGGSRFNQGPFTFSPNGTSIIITQNKPNKRKGSRARPRLALFKTEKRIQEWGLFKPLKFSGPSNFSVAHPSLSPDGQWLYFVSDMKDGFGKTDIYKAPKEADGWGTPKNLGPQINTSGKELFPFVHASGLLFFTSDGHGPKRDLNIYFVDEALPDTPPTPLPEPINSKADDFSCFIFEDTGRGYFASNRQGQDDLYEFSTPEIDLNLQEVADDNYCFTFFENGPDDSDSLPKIYRWSFGDGEQALGLEADHCFKGPGNYSVLLNVVDTITNEELFSVASYNLELKETRQVWFEVPDTLKTGASFSLKPILRGYDSPTEPPVYYWNFGDGIHQIGETISHIYRIKGKYRIICSTKLEEIGEISFFREVTVID